LHDGADRRVNQRSAHDDTALARYSPGGFLGEFGQHVSGFLSRGRHGVRYTDERTTCEIHQTCTRRSVQPMTLGKPKRAMSASHDHDEVSFREIRKGKRRTGITLDAGNFRRAARRAHLTSKAVF
jgi:hypothetical protein